MPVPNKPVKYVRHAKKRMKDREVSEIETELTIENSDICKPSVKGRINAYKFINGRNLRVIFKEETAFILAITGAIRKKPFRE